MNQELTQLRKTWEDPEKSLWFRNDHQPLAKVVPYLVLLFSAVLVILTFINPFIWEFFTLDEWIPEFLDVFFAIFFAIFFFALPISLFVALIVEAYYPKQPFFRTQKFYDEETFFNDAKETKKPYYHEVLKVERPDLTQAPPEFRDLPEADKLVMIETKILESSPAGHQDSIKWVLFLEPKEPSSIQPGDQLVSLHGKKTQDYYAVHAQSCELTSSFIIIKPKSVLLSFRGYIDTVKERKID